MPLSFLRSNMKKPPVEKKVKCPECEKLNIKSEAVNFRNRWYCTDCLEKRNNRANQSNDGWDELYYYIVDLYGHTPTGMMFQQLGRFRKPPYNYTNTGMMLTLKYFYETLGNEVMEDTGLGIIPYVYEDAKKNFIQNKNVNTFNSEFEYRPKVKTIKVMPTKHNGKKDPIDFALLEETDE